jgi:hypothetical protein
MSWLFRPCARRDERASRNCPVDDGLYDRRLDDERFAGSMATLRPFQCPFSVNRHHGGVGHEVPAGDVLFAVAGARMVTLAVPPAGLRPCM